MPNMDGFINIVINREPCAKHIVVVGEPCYIMKKEGVTRAEGLWDFYGGVCNKRAVAAGFSHEIDPASLNRGGTNRDINVAARKTRKK